MTVTRSRVAVHTITTMLDHQRGGWFSSCSCGWEAKRASWYKARVQGFAQEHLEGRRGNGAPNRLDPLQSQEVRAS